jgi:polyferredoxin
MTKEGLVNSDRLLLGLFLLLTIASAITVGFLYGGKTWCNYICPMAPVQMVYSEPSGLLTSVAHTARTTTNYYSVHVSHCRCSRSRKKRLCCL